MEEEEEDLKRSHEIAPAWMRSLEFPSRRR